MVQPKISSCRSFYTLCQSEVLRDIVRDRQRFWPYPGYALNNQITKSDFENTRFMEYKIWMYREFYGQNSQQILFGRKSKRRSLVSKYTAHENFQFFEKYRAISSKESAQNRKINRLKSAKQISKICPHYKWSFRVCNKNISNENFIFSFR